MVRSASLLQLIVAACFSMQLMVRPG
uniref:Uncharacterized protein n=1 Tax=Anguilla anguilla TaxID=7936 RepID=A0A0E9VTL4_ANGAN